MNNLVVSVRCTASSHLRVNTSGIKDSLTSRANPLVHGKNRREDQKVGQKNPKPPEAELDNNSTPWRILCSPLPVQFLEKVMENIFLTKFSLVTKNKTDKIICGMIGTNADYAAGKLGFPLGLRDDKGVWILSKNQASKVAKIGAKYISGKADGTSTEDTT